jgi:hypothetical protein
LVVKTHKRANENEHERATPWDFEEERVNYWLAQSAAGRGIRTPVLVRLGKDGKLTPATAEDACRVEASRRAGTDPVTGYVVDLSEEPPAQAAEKFAELRKRLAEERASGN